MQAADVEHGPAAGDTGNAGAERPAGGGAMAGHAASSGEGRPLSPDDEAFFKEIREAVRPDLRKAWISDIKYTSASRLKLRQLGDFWEIMSKLASGLSTVLAFAATPLESGQRVVAFLAGVFGTLSLVFLLLSGYLSRQARERNIQLNIMLEKIGVAALPDNFVNLDQDDVDNAQAQIATSTSAPATSTAVDVRPQAGSQSQVTRRQPSRGAMPMITVAD